MAALYQSLLAMSAAATAMYLLLKLFGKWTAKHFTATWHYYSYAAIYSIFVVPYSLALAATGWTFDLPSFASGEGERLPPSAAASPIGSGVPMQQQGGATAVAPLHDATHPPGGQAAWHLILDGAPYALAAVTLAYLAAIAIRGARLHRRIAMNIEPADDPDVLREMDACKRQLGIRRPVPVYWSPHADTPFLYGIWRPRIVLPSDMDWEAESLRHALLHELTHCRRRDIALLTTSHLVQALHWFNPFVYLARRDIARYGELSCDERVVRAMGREERKRYGELLLRVMRQKADRRIRLGTYSALGGGRSLIERRIRTIMNGQGANRRKSIRILAVCATLAIALTGAAAVYAASGQAPVANGSAKANQPAPSSTSARAGEPVPELEDITLKGEVGASFRSGDLLFERVEPDDVPPESEAFRNGTLAGQELTFPFEMTDQRKRALLTIQNKGAGHVIVSITAGSDTSEPLPGGIFRLPARSTWKIANTEDWDAGMYYVSFTSGSALMSGRLFIQ